MSAAEILTRLEAAGIQVRADGGRLIAAPRQRISDELRALFRANKVELLLALTRQGDPLPSAAAEAHRQRVLAMAAERSDKRYAVITDSDADPGAIILALAIWDVGTCELRIPRAKYDPFLLLDLIERHGGTPH